MRLPDLTSLAQMDERLREVAADRTAVQAALEEAERRLSDNETPALHTYAGQAARLLARHDVAIEHLARAHELEPTARTRIRLGEAYRCANRLKEAEHELRAALEEARGSQAEHYALQHLGKTLADVGKREEARAKLERALELRRESGDAELVASTEAALALLAG